MPETNIAKNLRGNSSKEALNGILELAKELGYITDIVKNHKIGRNGYHDQNQFKAPYLIRFSDGICWILFTTTSIRDRVKEQYWEAYNFKDLDASIKAAYLVYPDSISEKERHTAEAKNKKIQNGTEYSTLEGIVSQDQIANLIETYAIKDDSKGKQSDTRGNGFERRVAAILSNPINLQKWKSNSETIEGIHFRIFCNVVSCLGLQQDKIDKISATNDKRIIGLLPSGGAAKTDVLVTVIEGLETKYYTISCKRSSEKAVSIHQFTADTFADFLEKDNDELRYLLRLFQEKGNRKDMGEANAERLKELLQPFNRKLALWALGGIGGAGNPETQWANYLLTYDNNDGTVSMHTLNEYVELLISSNANGTFGTLFSWTYQGKRGSSIQLKSKIIK